MCGAFKFWMYLEKKYLPPLSGLDGVLQISRLACSSDDGKQQEIWDLWKDIRLNRHERLVLLSTFDYNYLPFEAIPQMVEAMRAVHLLMGENSNFGRQADALERLYNDRNDVHAVAFNATSVTSYTDVMGKTFDKESLDDMWEAFLSVEQTIKEK